MSNETNETIDDIVADIRAQNQGLPEDSYALSPLVCDLLSLADRIKAAYKRELADEKRISDSVIKSLRDKKLEMAREIVTKDAEIANLKNKNARLRVINCGKYYADCNLREAIENISEYAKAAACHTEDAHLLGYLNQIERWAEAALSAPPRNCDIGTPEEQHNRFMRFCESKSMGYCYGRVCRKCIAEWLQLPYEEGEAK